jgi:hypothetical protein
MYGIVTASAQRDQILLGVVPSSATKLFVVNLQIARCAAGLATPSIPFQDFLVELAI